MNHKKIHYGWIILTFSVLGTLSAIGLARFGYTMILPSMQEGLNLNNTQTGTLATGNFIGYLGLALIGGFLASHFNPRKVISLSLLLVGGTMVLTGFSQGFKSAFLFRTLTGMGSGGSNVPMMGLLSAWFATRRRGMATGLAITGSSLGLIITGPLVPWILNLFPENGWRVSWWLLGGFVFLVGMLAYIILRNNPHEKTLLPIGESVGLETGPTQLEKNNSPNSQNSNPNPKSWSSVYKSGVVWHLSLVYFMFGFSYIIYATYFAKYLQSEVGLSKETAGTYWQVVGWISICCGLFWGWVSDLIGRKYALAIVYFLQGISYWVFATWTYRAGISVSVFLFGITAWSIPAIMASACGDHLGPKLAPAALGFVTLFMGTGQAIGPWVAGRIADITSSFTLAFISAAIAALLGGVISLFLKRTH